MSTESNHRNLTFNTTLNKYGIITYFKCLRILILGVLKVLHNRSFAFSKEMLLGVISV